MKLVTRGATLFTSTLLWFLLVTIPPLVLTAFLTYQHARNAVQKEIQEFLVGYANKQIQLIDNYMKERVGDARVSSQNPIFKEIFPKLEEAFFKSGVDSPVYLNLRKEIQALVQAILSSYGYTSFYMVSLHGDIIFSAMPETVSETSLFSETIKTKQLPQIVKRVLETKEPGVARFDIYPTLRQEFSAFTVAPFIQGEKVIGVVILGFPPHILGQTISEYTGMGKTGETVLGAVVNSEIVFVAPTRFSPDAAFKKRVQFLLEGMPLQNAVIGIDGSGYSTDYRGQEVWAVWRYLPSVNLGMVVKMDTSEINARTEPIKKSSILVISFALLLILVTAFNVAKSITNPIKKLMETTKVIAMGQLNQRVQVEKTNEIGLLADSFNQMASELEKSYAKINSVVVNAMDGIITIHDDGRIESFNPAAERIFGYAVDELVGKNINLLMPEPYRTEHDGYLKKYLRTGQSKILGVAREIPALRKNGEVFPLETSISETFLGGQRLFTGIVRDVSERKRMEETFTRFGRILNDSFNEIYMFDSVTLHFVQVNQGAIQNTGYTLEELHELTPLDLKPKFNLEQFEALIEPLRLGTESHITFETTQKRKNDSIYPVEVHLHFSRNETPPLFVAIIKDITERKQAEEKLKLYGVELERSNEALRDFASIASHDLQEPLRKIITFGNRLCSHTLDEQGKDYLDRIQKATQRMQTFINDLLEYSKVSYKPRQLEMVNLNELVSEVISDLENRIERTQGSVNVGKLPAIESDRLQMRQLFQNMIGNALKFHRPGFPPKVSISARVAGPGHWEISFQDNGIGFDIKHLERIMKPFHRLHGRSEYEGSGIGLSICEKVVENLGGRISAESAPDKGTCFMILLPEKQQLDG